MMTKRELLNILTAVEGESQIDFYFQTAYGYESPAEIDYVKSELKNGTVNSMLILYKAEKEAAVQGSMSREEIAA